MKPQTIFSQNRIPLFLVGCLPHEVPNHRTINFMHDVTSNNLSKRLNKTWNVTHVNKDKLK